MNGSAPIVQMITIDQIQVINPRSPKEIVSERIISSISNLGLKKPITVARRQTAGDKLYDLVCGQGRLEAFVALGQVQIPALVIDATREECLLLSLVENVARRRRSPLDFLGDISNLQTRGYSNRQIAEKVDLDEQYVAGITDLLDRGEERLVSAVENGDIPLSVAIRIANSDEAGIQQALSEAYEGLTRRGRHLEFVRHVIRLHKTKGKKFERGPRRGNKSQGSARALVRVYQQEADRQKVLLKKVQLTSNPLSLLVSEMKSLFGDGQFLTLMQSEGLSSLPACLAERIQESKEASS